MDMAAFKVMHSSTDRYAKSIPYKKKQMWYPLALLGNVSRFFKL